MTSARVSPDVFARLRRAAEEDGLPVSNLLGDIIERWVTERDGAAAPASR